MKKSKAKSKTTTAIELIAKGLSPSGRNKGATPRDKASEVYHIIKNMKISDLVERFIDFNSKDRKDLSITENRIDLMTKVVNNAIRVMHRNGAKELSINIKGDIIEISFACEADNISISGNSYLYPYVVEAELSASKDKVVVDVNNVR